MPRVVSCNCLYSLRTYSGFIHDVAYYKTSLLCIGKCDSTIGIYHISFILWQTSGTSTLGLLWIVQWWTVLLKLCFPLSLWLRGTETKRCSDSCSDSAADSWPECLQQPGLDHLEAGSAAGTRNSIQASHMVLSKPVTWAITLFSSICISEVRLLSQS